MTTRDLSMEGLAAWVPELRPRWAIVVLPNGPAAEQVMGWPRSSTCSTCKFMLVCDQPAGIWCARYRERRR